jgi:hypothetical protein
VIVSSLGAVYSKSMTILKELLKCDDQKMKKIGRKMSEAAIGRSFEMWRKYMSSVEGPEEENKEAVEMIEKERKEEDKEWANDEDIGEEEEVKESNISEERGDEMAEEAAVMENM